MKQETLWPLPLIPSNCDAHKRANIRRIGFFDGFSMQSSAQNLFHSGFWLLRRKRAAKKGQMFENIFGVLRGIYR
jgi:hypothetical protein